MRAIHLNGIFHLPGLGQLFLFFLLLFSGVNNRMNACRRIFGKEQKGCIGGQNRVGLACVWTTCPLFGPCSKITAVNLSSSPIEPPLIVEIQVSFSFASHKP